MHKLQHKAVIFMTSKSTTNVLCLLLLDYVSQKYSIVHILDSLQGSQDFLQSFPNIFNISCKYSF